MRVIEVRPTQKFGGAWISFEMPGVEPVFPGPNGKRDAINYASHRFGGSEGEVQVFDDTGCTAIEKIKMDGRRQYVQA